MREVNLPKLIKEDTELFKNILRDQFVKSYELELQSSDSKNEMREHI